MLSRPTLVLGCVLLGVTLSFLPWMDRLELSLYDFRIEFMQEEMRKVGLRLHPAIQMVGIDDATVELDLYPRWSLTKGERWGPDQLARLIAQLSGRGARGVLYLQAEPERSARESKNRWRLSDALHMVQEGTGLLSRGLRLRQQDGKYLSDWQDRLAGDPIPACSVDFLADQDGVVRQAYLATRLPARARPVPSGALVLLARLLDVLPEDIKYGPDWIQVGPRLIPTTPDYTLRIRPLNPRSLSLKDLKEQELEGIRVEYLAPVSAARLLDLEDPLYQLISGRIVVMGNFQHDATEQVMTSYHRMKAIQFQACVLDTLLSEWYLQSPPAWAQSVLLVAGTFLIVALAALRRPLFALLTVTAGIVLLLAVNLIAFEHGTYLNLARPLVALIASSLALVALQLVTLMRSLRKFGGKSAFEAARSLDESGLNVIREQVATIVFCNVPELVKNLEKADSTDYFRRRQEFSMLLNDVAVENRGVVLDFQGDAPMIGFNAELERSDPQHAYHAVRACLEIVSMSDKLRQLWWDIDDDEQMAIRCGVATGPVAIGQVGARSSKLASAAIGDTTNVAARLLGAARRLNVEVLVAEETRNLCHNRFRFEDLPPVLLKGKAKPVPVARIRLSEL